MPAKGIDQPEVLSTTDVARMHQMEVLLRISKTAAALETLDEILVQLVEVISSELNAERSTIFLNDGETQELYSRVAQGNMRREIRILNTSGLAGHVFTQEKAFIVDDAYADERFNRSVDEQTGFVTRNLICVPIKTVKGQLIGVVQALNKEGGPFTQADQTLLESMATQAAIALQNADFIERVQRKQTQEMEFLEVVSNITSEIDLTALLQKVMSEATRLLNADRSTLFLNDERTGELFTMVGEGLGATEIRFPNHLGIAGTVFRNCQAVNIKHAYADLRFNPAFDKQTGYFTRSILCVPVSNKAGKTIGVTQVLNKRGGPFTEDDESRLRAFTAQIAIGLENAKLFNDVQTIKNYNESILQSMPSGVLTLDEDGRISTCNTSGLELLRVNEDNILGVPLEEFFKGPNEWIVEKVQRAGANNAPEISVDMEIDVEGEKLSVNVSVLPLTSTETKKLGSLIMIEDITSEKRMKSMMARYMDPSLADQLYRGGETSLEGRNVRATVLFSDIRGFTGLAEELGAQGTVALLNEYFTIMVECIQREGGMLDKFVGDAFMAAFGMPMSYDDDEDRAVRAAIAMLRELSLWNEERASQGKKRVNIGVGLNTDVVVSGNIGSPKRMDYTLIGDGVNVASRLEGACKQYGANILISEYTYRRLHGTYRIREVDRVVVHGKSEPVGIYEVLDYHTDETFPNLMGVVSHFHEGVKRYRERQWDAAMESFNQALDLHPKDDISNLYVARCQMLKEHPPADTWDGTWMMESK